MDKYIKMLLIKLSGKYKITITTTMFYNTDKQMFANMIKARVKRLSDDKSFNIKAGSKRELIEELMKYEY